MKGMSALKKKALISGLLSLLIFCQCSIPAHASETDSELCSEAVVTMQERGVIQGYANGELHLDDPVSYGELAVFLYRLRYADIPSVEGDHPWYYGAVSELVQSGDFPAGLTMDGSGSTLLVRNRGAIEILLPYFNIYPYPMCAYPDTEFDFVGLETDKMAWNAALQIGLIHESLDPMGFATRGQLLEWMYQLETKSYEPLKCPVDHPIMKSIQSEADWESRNGFIKAMANIPEKYLQDFAKSGWKLYFDKNDPRFEEYSEAIGLTYYGSKVIVIRSSAPSTSYHEFGHYVASRAGIQLMLGNFYDLESKKTAGVLREYAMTNASEYFACFFAMWLEAPDQRAVLEEKAPYTSALIRDALLGAEGLVDKEKVDELYSDVIDALNAR